jgi:hypothetical protein
MYGGDTQSGPNFVHPIGFCKLLPLYSCIALILFYMLFDEFSLIEKGMNKNF